MILQWDNASLRERERGSILEFLTMVGHLFTDSDVLDLGCGKQPYRGLVEAHGGRYTPYDRMGYPASTVTTDVGQEDPLSWSDWDVILCTQVIQYVSEVDEWLREIRDALRPTDGERKAGVLVMTGPTNWPEVEPEDLWRFTQRGISLLLEEHFALVNVYHRDSIAVNDIRLSMGWGAVAWR